MSTRRFVWLIVVLFGGCEQEKAPVDYGSAAKPVPQEAATEKSPVTEAQAVPELTPPKAAPPSPAIDPSHMLDQLREAVATLGPDWAIAKSPVTWSTLTVSFSDPFSADTAAKVWAKWTEPVTALTLKKNQQIKSEIEKAVAEADPGKMPVEHEFDSVGFRFVITASNGTVSDTRFVRISFVGAT